MKLAQVFYKSYGYIVSSVRSQTTSTQHLRNTQSAFTGPTERYGSAEAAVDGNFGCF